MHQLVYRTYTYQNRSNSFMNFNTYLQNYSTDDEEPQIDFHQILQYNFLNLLSTQSENFQSSYISLFWTTLKQRFLEIGSFSWPKQRFLQFFLQNSYSILITNYQQGQVSLEQCISMQQIQRMSLELLEKQMNQIYTNPIQQIKPKDLTIQKKIVGVSIEALERLCPQDLVQNTLKGFEQYIIIVIFKLLKTIHFHLQNKEFQQLCQYMLTRDQDKIFQSKKIIKNIVLDSQRIINSMVNPHNWILKISLMNQKFIIINKFKPPKKFIQYFPVIIKNIIEESTQNIYSQGMFQICSQICKSFLKDCQENSNQHCDFNQNSKMKAIIQVIQNFNEKQDIYVSLSSFYEQVLNLTIRFYGIEEGKKLIQHWLVDIEVFQNEIRQILRKKDWILWGSGLKQY